ncbi:hypothetical protein DNTS_006763 [Danionella cerebrum]|uniref:Uncharacterized protein n=1 Tax=Danionella cerebrum TaxID=2873325 RepID=A0A553N442_9TELE|nr:hypothetical protein DNTS_006763 [Danionella translucida]
MNLTLVFLSAALITACVLVTETRAGSFKQDETPEESLNLLENEQMTETSQEQSSHLTPLEVITLDQVAKDQEALDQVILHQTHQEQE